jgi:hypothetical protein
MAIHAASPRAVRDRFLSIGAAVLLPAIVLAGFARTYYLKGLFDTPPLRSSLVHLHGALMTAWVALFITQIWLVSSRRVRVHQRLGLIGATLAVAVVVVGLLTAVVGAAHGAAPKGVPPLVFLVVPTMDMVVFVILLSAALYFRRRPEIHKRLMVLTAFNFLPPAVARIQLPFIQNAGLPAIFGIADALLLVAVAYDTWRHRRLHPAMALGALLILLSLPLRIALGGTAWWMRLATWATGWVAV